MELIFYLSSFTIILSSLGVVTSSNPVYSVLWLIFTFLNSSVIFILLGAEFIAMTIVIVYVGAVAVLFLFVVMMLNIGVEKFKKTLLSNKILAALVFFVILADFFMIIHASFVEGYTITGIQSLDITEGLTNTHAIGSVLYTNYLVPFQLSGLILLIAMIGCIVLSLRTRENVKRQDPTAQVKRTIDDSLEIKKVKIKEGVDGINYS